MKKSYYYCDNKECRCIESEVTEKAFRVIGRITVGLYAGFMGYYLRRQIGILKLVTLLITSLIVVLLEDIVHWKFAKFIPIINENEEKAIYKR